MSQATETFPVNALRIDGDYPALLRRLFKVTKSGVHFGTAHSIESLRSTEDLADWTVFADTVRGALVHYRLRVADARPGLRLEFRLLGTKRDPYIVPAIQGFLAETGLAASAA